MIDPVPCAIKLLLKAPKTTAAFYDFHEYERLVEAARTDVQAYLIVLLGGEAGFGEWNGHEWALRLGRSAVEGLAQGIRRVGGSP